MLWRPHLDCRVVCSECTRSTPGLADSETSSAVVGAAAQCIYLLYGLDLPERNEQWTDGFQVGTPSSSASGVRLELRQVGPATFPMHTKNRGCFYFLPAAWSACKLQSDTAMLEPMCNTVQIINISANEVK